MARVYVSSGHYVAKNRMLGIDVCISNDISYASKIFVEVFFVQGWTNVIQKANKYFMVSFLDMYSLTNIEL